MIRARVINTVYQFDAKQRNHAFLLTFDNSDTFFVYNISLSRNDIITNVKYTCLFKLNVLKIALFAVFFLSPSLSDCVYKLFRILSPNLFLFSFRWIFSVYNNAPHCLNQRKCLHTIIYIC